MLVNAGAQRDQKRESETLVLALWGFYKAIGMEFRSSCKVKHFTD